MIPKIIHYCWLSSDPIPVFLEQCMASWKNKMPDYQFILWNFERFNVSDSLWVQQAFQQKKYAFAADYIRLYALYHYGGIYLDMDVEVLQSYDPFLFLNTMLCFENSSDKRLEVAAFGCAPRSLWVKICLDYYKDRPFVKDNGLLDTKVLPCVISDILRKNKFRILEVKNIDDAFDFLHDEKLIPVFPCEYFSPKSYGTGKIQQTKRTYSIHHFSGSWLPWYAKCEKMIFIALGLTYRDITRKIIAGLKCLFK